VAGLFLRSLERPQHVDLGFVADRVWNFMLDPSEIGYTRQQGENFYREALDRVRRLPGVESASLALAVPLGDAVYGDNVRVQGYQTRPGEAVPSVLYDAVSPGFFKTLRINLVRGRDFGEGDNAGSSRVAVINEAMAEKFWPHQDPIGSGFSMESDAGRSIEIVGVVKNTRITGVSGVYEPCFYLPLAQHYAPGATLQIRNAYAADSIVREARELVGALAPGMPVLRVQTMQASLGGINGLFGYRRGVGLTGALGLLGVALAVVGVFGVTSYIVSQRTQEFGVRLALGAQRQDIWRAALLRESTMIATGILLGLIAGAAVAQLLGDFLVDVSPLDPLTYVGVSAMLAVLALLACYLPARRATRIDPLMALRNEWLAIFERMSVLLTD